MTTLITAAKETTKSQDPKKSLGLPAKPKKSLDQKFTPKISHADFVALKSSRKGKCDNTKKNIGN